MVVEDNEVPTIKANHFLNVTNWFCRKDKNDCDKLKEYIHNQFANRVIGGIDTLENKKSYEVFDEPLALRSLFGWMQYIKRFS